MNSITVSISLYTATADDINCYLWSGNGAVCYPRSNSSF